MTVTKNTASSPPANMKRYCAFSPLNSTDLPIPLFISHPAIITGRMNVIWLQPQSGRYMHRTMMPQSLMCLDHQTELVIHLYTSNQSYNCTNGIDKFSSRIKIRCNHLCCFLYSGKSITLSSCLLDKHTCYEQCNNILFFIQILFKRFIKNLPEKSLPACFSFYVPAWGI